MEENKGKYFKYNYCKFCAQVLNCEIFSKFCLFLNVASCCLNVYFFYNFYWRIFFYKLEAVARRKLEFFAVWILDRLKDKEIGTQNVNTYPYSIETVQR